jgi:adenylate cyclase
VGSSGGPKTVENVERKLVAILAADVAGYSRLMRANEVDTLAALSGHRQVIDQLIQQQSGRIASTAGDSVLAEFPTVLEAVECAVDMQQAMRARNADKRGDEKMLLRIGVNVSDVMVKDDDIFGDGVNLAARIQTLAMPGAICVSRSVRDHLRDRSPFVFDDLGEHAVKNIARPIRVFSVRFEGSPTFPSIAEEGAASMAEDMEPKEVEMAFWDSIKDSAQESDYRAYLDKYPEGSFATLAQSRIDGVRDGAPKKAADASDESATQVEIVFWESIKDSSNPEMFQAYLQKYAAGSFAPLARAKIQELERGAKPN